MIDDLCMKRSTPICGRCVPIDIQTNKSCIEYFIINNKIDIQMINKFIENTEFKLKNDFGVKHMLLKHLNGNYFVITNGITQYTLENDTVIIKYKPNWTSSENNIFNIDVIDYEKFEIRYALLKNYEKLNSLENSNVIEFEIPNNSIYNNSYKLRDIKYYRKDLSIAHEYTHFNNTGITHVLVTLMNIIPSYNDNVIWSVDGIKYAPKFMDEYITVSSWQVLNDGRKIPSVLSSDVLLYFINTGRNMFKYYSNAFSREIQLKLDYIRTYHDNNDNSPMSNRVIRNYINDYMYSSEFNEDLIELVISEAPREL